MKPEFAQALQNCLNFSHEKGRSINLLKNNSKRKRMRSEIEEVKQEEQELKDNKQEFLQQVKRLKQERLELYQKVEELSQANQQFVNLFDQEELQEQQQQFQI